MSTPHIPTLATPPAHTRARRRRVRSTHRTLRYLGVGSWGAIDPAPSHAARAEGGWWRLRGDGVVVVLLRPSHVTAPRSRYSVVTTFEGAPQSVGKTVAGHAVPAHGGPAGSEPSPIKIPRRMAVARGWAVERRGVGDNLGPPMAWSNRYGAGVTPRCQLRPGWHHRLTFLLITKVVPGTTFEAI